MAALTQDQQIVQYGAPGDAHQPLNFPLGANTTVYRGSIALYNPTTGALKNASSPSAIDICVGLIDQGGPGVPNFSPGIANTSTVASTLGVTIDIRTGSYYLAGDNTITSSTVGQTVYVKDEITITQTAGTSPKCGTLLYIDPAPPITALGPYVVKFNVVGSP